MLYSPTRAFLIHRIQGLVNSSMIRNKDHGKVHVFWCSFGHTEYHIPLIQNTQDIKYTSFWWKSFDIFLRQKISHCNEKYHITPQKYHTSPKVFKVLVHHITKYIGTKVKVPLRCRYLLSDGVPAPQKPSVQIHDQQ